MESLIELCDLISQNPAQFADKLTWLCNRCPQPEALLAGSPRVSHSQINAMLAISRFLSKTLDHTDNRPKSLILTFFRSIPTSFHPSFWPQSFPNDSIASFFTDFLAYLSKSAESDPDFSVDVAGFVGEAVVAAIGNNADENWESSAISRVFLIALTKNFVPMLPEDGEKLITCLLDQFNLPVQVLSSPSERIGMNSGTSSSQSSPLSNNVNSHNSSYSAHNELASMVNDLSQMSVSSSSASTAVVVNGSGVTWTNGLETMGVGLDGGGVLSRQQVASFEEESVEGYEKQEIAYKLIGHVLDCVRIDNKLLDQVRLIAKKQLQSLFAFLKIRKRDWNEQGQLLKARISAKLSVYQAAARMKVQSLASFDVDGKTSKWLLLETLALLMDAAEACLLSVWRKLRVCEELFSSLLGGIAQIAVTRGGQPMRVLLIRLKPLVLAACAQADTWGSSQVMFEIVMKTSCQIIESGWTKDRAPVDTFISGLASSIRERNDYDEQVDKKQGVPVVQLNVVRLLADMTVSVNKSEVVDMILPLFIESLEEGDASTPGLLRLRLLDAVSRIASLGFEKSYRETVVLMTRSYLSKLSSVGSAESKVLAAEATTERVETLPAGFLLIASRLKNMKMHSDYRHRLLSLCSDVGLAAESKSGRSGADFLGPLLLAVAEICSDFDPTVDVEPSLLKLFRNLWFYVALFGLAPPVQKTQQPTKSVSTTLNSVGSMGTIALQSVGGPYMWNAQWSSAVQQIAQGTPPLS